MDTSGAVEAITAIGVSAGALGAAMLLVMVGIKAWKVVRGAM